MLKNISTKAQCSKVHTHHTLQHMTTTAMRKMYNLQQTALVTGHKNYQCLETYINEPDEEEHIKFYDTSFDYTSPLHEADDQNQENKNHDKCNQTPTATVGQ